MKYVLNWNDEYLDMRIVCGPMDEKHAKQEMKKHVVKRLVELNVTRDTKEAEELYSAAEEESVEKTIYELHVSPEGASIMYNDYEDRYQIVDYNQ